MSHADQSTPTDGSEIAIIGLSCRFPGAANIDTFWRNLCNAVESITFLQEDELETTDIDLAARNSPNYVKAAPLLGDIDLFDAAFFDYTPREAEIMDPQQRLFLECAWEVLEDAGYDPERFKGAIGVYAGARTNTYLFNLFLNPATVADLGAFQIGLGNDLGFLPTRVSYKLNLRGPSCAVQTACSTSLVAIHLACQSLLIDECRIALAGGVAINVPHKTGYLYQPGGVVSPDGHCRAFDARAQGTIFGSGIGVAALKRLEDALADGDHIYAIIRGSAINNDGAAKASFTAPSVYGQTNVIVEALMNAGVSAETIGYLEAHGTGTALGDPIEVRALTKAFRASSPKNGFCAIGSIKTNLGHLDAAAGIASFIKAVLALKHKQIPPSLHFEQPNPQIDFAASPFYVNTALTPWQANGHPRRAGVSSFGIGGTNAHIILEEAPPSQPSSAACGWQLLTLSAKTEAALETATDNLVAYLQQHPEANLADLAYTLHVGRQIFKYRRAVVVRDHDDAIQALETRDPQRVFTAAHELSGRPVMFLFPGQGTRFVHATAELYQGEPVFRAEIDRCAELLRPQLGLDLRTILYPDDRRPTTDDRGLKIEDSNVAATEKLSSILYPLSSDGDGGQWSVVGGQESNQTRFVQPALFAIEYALAKLWESWGIKPKAMLGHSLGEYVAACLAGVFSLEDALALVAARGRLMQELPPGAMLAVNLAEERLRPMLEPELSIAAINMPEQCVVAGPAGAINRLQDTLSQAGTSCHRLNTSHAFHSAMMDPIIDEFSGYVRRVAMNPPTKRYISNVTGTWITDDDAQKPEYWAAHLRQTVQFAAGVQEVLNEPDCLILEVGPGQTLSRLVPLHPAHTPNQGIFASLSHQGEQPDAQAILNALGRLWLAGVPIEWRGYHAHARRRRLPLPTYPFERRRYWVAPQAQSPAALGRPMLQGKLPDVTDWFYLPSWKQTRPLPPASAAGFGDQPRHWLVFANQHPLSAMLVKHLGRSGQPVTLVHAGPAFQQTDDRAYTINPQVPEDYAALVKEARVLEHPAVEVVHLWSLTVEQQAQLEAEQRFKLAQEHGYYSLLYLVQALTAQHATAALSIQVIANRLHDLSGDELVDPEKAPLLGLCKVIPQEHPHIRCRSIDVLPVAPGTPQADHMLAQLMAEIGAQPADTTVAYRGSRRWAQSFEPIRLEKDTQILRSLRHNGVYLITGGLGGVGLILAEYLAQTVQANLILTRRSAFPPKAEWELWLATHEPQDATSQIIRRLQKIESYGAQVLVISADAADEAQMRAVVARIDQRFGTLNGVIHAAGITSGSSVFNALSTIGRTQSEFQFQPKAYAVYVLERVLRGRTIDFCLLCSSMAAVLGGLGFGAYAAANLFMDAFALNQSKAGATPWISANWDHWPEDTRQYANVQTSVDQYSMTHQESLEAFARLVAYAPAGQVIVATGGLLDRLSIWLNPGSTHQPDNAATAPVHARPQVQSAYVAPRNTVEQAVADIWARVLGLDRVGVFDNFFDLRGHSLLAMQIVTQVNDSLQVELPLVDLFMQPTVADMATMVLQKKLAQADSQMLEEVFQELEQI